MQGCLFTGLLRIVKPASYDESVFALASLLAVCTALVNLVLHHQIVTQDSFLCLGCDR